MTYRFGAFELDADTGELRKSGVRIKIGGQPLEVLTLLARRQGELVTREELKDALWKEETFTDFDHGVNTAVQRIRRALGDSAQSPRFVETLPRKGYRFVPPVERDSQPKPLHEPDSPARPKQKVAPQHWIFAAVGLALAGVAVLHYVAANPSRGLLRGDFLGQSPLTNYTGMESYPNLSRDGTEVAFAWDGEDGDNVDVYLKLVDAEGDTTTRLTEEPQTFDSPGLSPDGAQIAFLRAESPNALTATVMLRPSHGPGAERPLYETGLLRDLAPGAPCSEISWSPDGQWLALCDRNERSGSAGLLLLSPETGKTFWLTSPEQDVVGDNAPSFSPDGKSIAFVRRTGQSSGHEIYVVRLTDQTQPLEPEVRLTNFNRYARCPVWTPDGEEILFLGGPSANQSGLWSVSPSGTASPRFVRALSPGDSPTLSGLTAARDKPRFAYALDESDTDVWGVNLRGTAKGASFPLVSTTRGENHAKLSPTGDRLVFVSNRSGNPELWISDHDGTGAWKLTDTGAQINGFPSWSPSGDRIAFHSRPQGQADIYLADANGGPLRQLTNYPGDDYHASWSHDGSWVYFASKREGQDGIWRVSADGGTPQRMTERPGFRPQESRDGTRLYFLAPNSWDLWVQPLTGGDPQGVAQLVKSGPVHYSYVVANDGLYYVQPETSMLHFFDDASGQSRELFPFDGRPSGLSPGEGTLLYGRGRTNRDLMLLETVP